MLSVRIGDVKLMVSWGKAAANRGFLGLAQTKCRARCCAAGGTESLAGAVAEGTCQPSRAWGCLQPGVKALGELPCLGHNIIFKLKVPAISFPRCKASDFQSPCIPPRWRLVLLGRFYNKGPGSWSCWSPRSLGSRPAPPVAASLPSPPMQSPCCLLRVGFSPFP